MNLGDPKWELIDPTPNVHMLLIHFDKLFFWTKLASRAVVRWSKKMYSCAGACSYDRGGLCDIALSEPLLKLRPRKDLIETLLHEMIHAFLFVTNTDRDRDGHGANFQSHMHRINKCAGLNITIYHNFHDEVNLYLTHWWRCNGPCQNQKPYFGMVRRSVNRAPGPSDYWWSQHLRQCGGTYLKIKEPEKPQKSKKVSKEISKPNADITKYVTSNKNIIDGNTTELVFHTTKLPAKINITTKTGSTVTINIEHVIINHQPTKNVAVFSGKSQTISGRNSPGTMDAINTVQNVWAKKKLPTLEGGKNVGTFRKSIDSSSINYKKTKAQESSTSPPRKIKKINDYFKNNAQSILKDVYGQDFVLKDVENGAKISAVQIKSDLNNGTKTSVLPLLSGFVDCPVCNSKISKTEINKHLDECLHKEVLGELSKVEIKLNQIKTDPDFTKDIKTNYETTPSSPLLRFTNIIQNNIEDKNSNIVPTIKSNDINAKAKLNGTSIKIEPSTSKDIKQNCVCCGQTITKTIEEHLDECLVFFNNNTTIPEEGSSSIMKETILIDDDDELDETLTFNASGTKSPCPCCLKMVEQADMNHHLDICL